MNTVEPHETLNQALNRFGFHRVDHDPGDDMCNALRDDSGRTVGACFGRHVERISDGAPVTYLGCSASYNLALHWVKIGCPMDTEEK